MTEMSTKIRQSAKQLKWENRKCEKPEVEDGWPLFAWEFSGTVHAATSVAATGFIPIILPRLL